MPSSWPSLLPGWTIIHGVPNATTNTQPSWAKPNAFGVPPKTIITSVAGAAQRYLHANVIVNACGGSWPQIPEAAGAAKTNLLIIDFIDDGNQLLEADTNDRIAAYRKRGWPLHGVPVRSVDASSRRTKRRKPRRQQQNTSRRSYRPQQRY